MTEPNIDNLRATARWLRGASAAPHLHGSPDMPKWDQSMFYKYRPECGTTCCVAGYAATVLGQGVPDTKHMGFDRPYVAGLVSTPDGRFIHIEDYAREVLGLTEHQANTLFYGVGNDLEQLIQFLSSYAGEDL